MRKHNLIFLLCLLPGLLTLSVLAQQAPENLNLEEFLSRAEDQSQKYAQTFRNLSAQELKTKTFYRADGSVGNRRVTKSTFVVYQSPTTNGVQEFRSVLESNGKNVARSDKATAEFFAKLARQNTSAEEIEKLRKESLRFDGPRNPWGTTLFQIRPFMPQWREAFKFRLVGRELIEQRETWAIEYEQTQPSLNIVSSPLPNEPIAKESVLRFDTQISDDFRPTNPRLKGKIWLDAENAQILRHEFRVLVYPKNLSAPVVVQELSFLYQPSRFGISLPKQIRILSYVIKGSDDKSLRITKDIEHVFDYANYIEFDSTTNDYKPSVDR